MAYKIEKNIPVPARTGRAAAPDSFTGTLRRLQVGESVLNPGATQNTLAGLASKILGKGNFATRKEDKGVRIWRMA
jgi:hypothetical protein